jgi:hypothetical protein
LFITSNEKPKAGDWSLYQNKIHKCIEDIVGDEFKKIILTTDYKLAPDVQKIDDEFLEWFVNNPSFESVEVQKWFDGVDFLEYKIIIPSQERVCNCGLKESEHNVRHPFIPKLETLKESFYRIRKSIDYEEFDLTSFELGVKYQTERSYSDEEVLELLNNFSINSYSPVEKNQILIWFNKIKKK